MFFDKRSNERRQHCQSPPCFGLNTLSIAWKWSCVNIKKMPCSSWDIAPIFLWCLLHAPQYRLLTFFLCSLHISSCNTYIQCYILHVMCCSSEILLLCIFYFCLWPHQSLSFYPHFCRHHKLFQNREKTQLNNQVLFSCLFSTFLGDRMLPRVLPLRATYLHPSLRVDLSLSSLFKIGRYL